MSEGISTQTHLPTVTVGLTALSLRFRRHNRMPTMTTIKMAMNTPRGTLTYVIVMLASTD